MVSAEFLHMWLNKMREMRGGSLPQIVLLGEQTVLLSCFGWIQLCMAACAASAAGLLPAVSACLAGLCWGFGSTCIPSTGAFQRLTISSLVGCVASHLLGLGLSYRIWLCQPTLPAQPVGSWHSCSSGLQTQQSRCPLRTVLEIYETCGHSFALACCHLNQCLKLHAWHSATSLRLSCR